MKPEHDNAALWWRLRSVSLEKLVRDLREAWFLHHLMSCAPEREWEEEDTAKWREERNAKLREQFDEQTEGILRGEDFPLTPRSAHEMS